MKSPKLGNTPATPKSTRTAGTRKPASKQKAGMAAAEARLKTQGLKLDAEKIIKAWKDDSFRESLSPLEREQLPKNPIGEIEWDPQPGDKAEELFGTVAASCSTVAASCSTVAASCSTVAASCSTVGSDCSTVASECSTVSSACSTVASSCSTVASSCSTIASDCSTRKPACNTHQSTCKL